jgi:tetratricopeptide (TPR) repeat protein
MSATFGALGIVVLFFLIANLVRDRRGAPRTWVDFLVIYGSAAVAASFTAWSNTYWTNAVEAEVYAIASFVMGLTVLLARRWARDPENPDSTRAIFLIVYLLSLGVGFHLGTVLTYPAILLYLLLFEKKSFNNSDLLIFSFGFFLFLAYVNLQFGGAPAFLMLIVFLVLVAVRYAGGHRFAAVASGLLLLGVSIHLFLLIRSPQNPGIDEADPATWQNLMAVLRREQYPPGNPFVRKASWGFQIVDHFWRYMREQYELVKPGSGALAGQRLAYLPIVVGLAGMVSMARTRRREFVLLFTTFLVTSLGLIVYLNFSDGTRGVQPEVRERDYFYSPAFYFFGVFLGLGLAALLDAFFAVKPGERLSRIDRLGYVAGIVIFAVLSGLLYSRYHFEHDRTRERVPWGYGYNLLAGLEPNALVFTNGDNDTFPLWYQQEVEGFRRDVRVLNLSLLNTSWYIHQLKENDPKVEVTWSREQIDNLRGEIRGDRVYQPRDLAVRQILRDNYGKRPIYFAVTIPQEGLEDYLDYLVIEGLVFRFTNVRGRGRVDYEKIEHNVTQVYRYDGILTPDGKHDESVYRDENQRTLVQNYSGAFVRLGRRAEELAAAASDEATRRVNLESALDWYNRALAISPDSDAVLAQLGSLYIDLGRAGDAVSLFEGMLRQQPEDDRWLFKLSESLLEAGRYDEGLARLNELVKRNPEDEFVNQYLVQVLHELGKSAEAEAAVAGWDAKHPGGSSMREFYDAVRSGLTGQLLRGDETLPAEAPVVDSIPVRR